MDFGERVGDIEVSTLEGVTPMKLLPLVLLFALAPGVALSCSSSSVRPNCVAIATEALENGVELPEEPVDIPEDYWAGWTPVEGSTGFYVNAGGEEEYVPESPESLAWNDEEQRLFEEYMASMQLHDLVGEVDR